MKRGELVLLSKLLGRSTRTLRAWKRRDGGERRPGRAPHSAEEKLEARLWIEPLWKELPRGHDGWRTVEACLEREGIDVATRLVQGIVRELKAERRLRVRERIEKERVHVEVLARDAVWCADQTHLGRDAHGKVSGLVVRDALCSRMLAVSVGPPAKGRDLVRLLEHAAEERGAWPFVLQLDNGSENKNALVEERLRKEHVIVQWNEPRTPQHNPRAERTIGDLKRACGLPEREKRDADLARLRAEYFAPDVLATRTNIGLQLCAAWRALDERTPRAALGGLTPLELDRIALRAEDRACRARFHGELCCELERIALEPGTKRDRRRMEREAIWCALERHGLVKRTRGGGLSRPSKRKD
jgi:hypothetical protein